MYRAGVSATKATSTKSAVAEAIRTELTFDRISAAAASPRQEEQHERRAVADALVDSDGVVVAFRTTMETIAAPPITPATIARMSRTDPWRSSWWRITGTANAIEIAAMLYDHHVSTTDEVTANR